MREKVLSNDQVIAEVNRSFVPLWVNVKKEHLPNLPALAQAPKDDRRCITGNSDFVGRGMNRAFYARSWVISPDGKRLLNRQKSWHHEETPQDYLATLQEASSQFAAAKRDA